MELSRNSKPHAELENESVASVEILSLFVIEMDEFRSPPIGSADARRVSRQAKWFVALGDAPAKRAVRGPDGKGPREARAFWVQASVAGRLRAPPCAARRKGLDFGSRAAYAARATGARLSLATVLCGPITAVPHRAKANTFTRSSILFRPRIPPTKEILVEPPGTAPGSEPLITCAFIAIVPEGTG